MTFPTPRPGARRALSPSVRQLAKRLGSLASLWSHRRAQRENAGWAGRLETQEKALLALVQGMESEFLATSEGLEGLAGRLGKIQTLCQALTDLTMGNSEDAAVQFAFQLLKKSEDLVLASYDQYDQVFSTFNDLQLRLAQLSRSHDELMRVLLPLNFISISFRIEASRHPLSVQQAFFTLADDVNRTVSEVRTTLESQFDKLATSEQIARNLIGETAASIQRHRENIAATLDASRQQLHALNDALVSCKEGTMDLNRLNAAVNRDISGMVMAQQCHDITRQKIEHIAQAMQEMRSRLDGSFTHSPATEAEVHHFIFGAGQIQLQQVQNVFDQLNGAAESLKSSIKNLHEEAAGAATAAIKVGDNALDANVARQCQKGISEILQTVRQAVQKIAEIITVFEPLQTSFIDCTGKATALAGDVRHAGLNAQVFAIHAPDGATLEVLAGHMAGISANVIEHVGQMGASLNHVASMVSNLRERLEDFQELGRAEEEVLIAESVTSQQKLAELEASIPELIGHITREQKAFAKAIENVLAQVRFPESVAQASPQAIGFFGDLIAWSRDTGAQGSADSATGQQLERLKANYTMASERLTHETASLTDSNGNSPAADQPEHELFTDFESEPPVAAPLADAAEPAACAVDASQPMVENAPLNETPPQEPGPAPSPAASTLGDNVELF